MNAFHCCIVPAPISLFVLSSVHIYNVLSPWNWLELVVTVRPPCLLIQCKFHSSEDANYLNLLMSNCAQWPILMNKRG